MKKKILPAIAIIAALAIGYGIGSQQNSSPGDPVRHYSSSQSQYNEFESIITATPKPTAKPTKKPNISSKKQTYILNTNTKKFHIPSCPSVKQMKESNKKVSTDSRDEIIAEGYDPCGRCHP